MLEVYVPATSANIGPGYDCLGLCLDLFNKFTFEELESGLQFEGCDETFANEDNLVYKTMLFFYDKIKPKKIPKGIKISFENNIPICRGLGSSSTCIVAGLMAANVLSEANLDKDEILKLAIELEGHPDNVAPAIYGNMIIAFMEDGNLYHESIKVPEEIRFLAMVPDFELSTEKARAVLPKEIPHKHGVFNVSRCALLIAAFTKNNLDLVKAACKDKFHQDYRSHLINNYDDIVAYANSLDSLGTFLSGAGPTIMTLAKDGDDEILDKMKSYLAALPDNWQILDLHCDPNGAYYKEV